MIVRTNQSMKTILGNYNKLEDLAFPLPGSLLQELKMVEFVKVGEVITFKGALDPSEEGLKNPTGIECQLHWHLDDYVSDEVSPIDELPRLGISFAVALQEKLTKTAIPGNYRIIVSLNNSDADIGPTCTVRFHQIRQWDPWLQDDLEFYRYEALLTLDWEIS